MSSVSQVRVPVQQQPVNLIELSQRTTQPAGGQTRESSFKEMFSQELAADRNVSFSRHARQRLFSRGVKLSDNSLNGLAEAIDKAQTKGSKETLVLTDQAAFVVSVPNRTVITVFDRDNLREGVVTSIDSAVIV
ncbi:MAG: TIGR02530 family flagellar biosynthesis protein [Candidatus Zixiibacteriota bacterium]